MAAEAGITIEIVRVGADAADRDGQWATDGELGPQGAVLVRPDHHCAWRSTAISSDPAADLREALGQILGQPVAAAA